MTNKSFLKRWSEKKQQDRDASDESHVLPQASPSISDNAAFVDDQTGFRCEPAEEHDECDSQAQDLSLEPVELQTPESLNLADVDAITEESGVANFLVEGVDPKVKLAALNKLFQLPMFNVRDGLNEYDLDYSKAKNLSAEALAELKHWGAKAKDWVAEDEKQSDEAAELVAVPKSENQTVDICMEDQASTSSQEARVETDSESQESNANNLSQPLRQNVSPKNNLS